MERAEHKRDHVTLTPMPELTPSMRDDLARAVHMLKAAGCSAVYLFGSVASGTYHDGSDIDLAVSGCTPERYFSLLGSLLGELEHPVDLVDLDAPDTFAARLRHSGTLVQIG